MRSVLHFPNPDATFWARPCLSFVTLFAACALKCFCDKPSASQRMRGGARTCAASPRPIGHAPANYSATLPYAPLTSCLLTT